MQSTLEPAHPITASYPQSGKGSLAPLRLFGLAMIAAGVGGWWYNWHLAETEGEFYIKLCIFGPLGLAGGLLMLLRPEWAGPLRRDSTRAHKIALFSVLGFMFIASGIDFYRLKHSHSKNAPPSRASVIAWSPSMGVPPKSLLSERNSERSMEMNFLNQTYQLGSYNQKHNPTWEFVTGGETVDDWKTLVTIIDRPDARTHEELDRLAEGVMVNYKTHGGQILLAKTMREDSGATFNYMVAAFEEPAKQRYELNFVKVRLGSTNAVISIYGVRISDPQDYRTKAKNYLDQSSGEVGRALGAAVLPEISKLPRRVFQEAEIAAGDAAA